MANQTVTSSTITVHGRGSLVLPFKVNDASNAQVDISGWTVYFEVDGVPIREQLVADPDDALGLLLKLERTQIAQLSKTAKRFAFVDETNSVDDLFFVLWNGTIARTEYVGSADATDDA